MTKLQDRKEVYPDGNIGEVMSYEDFLRKQKEKKGVNNSDGRERDRESAERPK